MRVAFLGLGIMGRPMASNLVKAGHEVSVWSRSGKEVEGARRAASPADAAQGAEVVWMCVSDTNAVEGILVRTTRRRRVSRRGHDHCRFQHDLTFGNPPVCRESCRQRRALCGCAHDRIEGGGRGRYSHLYRGRRRSGDRIAEAAVCRHGQGIFPHGRNQQGTGRQAGDEPSNCLDL